MAVASRMVCEDRAVFLVFLIESGHEGHEGHLSLRISDFY